MASEPEPPQQRPKDKEVHRAAASDPARLSLLLDSDPSLLIEEGQFGRQPLHSAAAAGNEESVRLLLKRGASPHVADILFQTTPLHLAVTSNSLGCVEELLSAGGDPNTADSLEETPIFYASSRPVVERLKSAGADLTVTTKEGRTAFLSCISYGKSFEVVELWLTQGVNLNHVPSFGWPALHAACGTAYLRCGIEGSVQVPILRLLLDAGADINLRDHSGKTAIHHACQWGFPECVRLLLANGADPNLPLPSNLDTPLDYAVFMHRTEIAKLMVLNGAKHGPRWR